MLEPRCRGNRHVNASIVAPAGILELLYGFLDIRLLSPEPDVVLGAVVLEDPPTNTVGISVDANRQAVMVSDFVGYPLDTPGPAVRTDAAALAIHFRHLPSPSRNPS